MKLIHKDVKFLTNRNESILNLLYSSRMPGTRPLHGGWTWLLATCQSLPETSTAQLVHHYHYCHHRYHSQGSQYYHHHHPFSFIHIFTHSHNYPHCDTSAHCCETGSKMNPADEDRCSVWWPAEPLSLTVANLQCNADPHLKFLLCNNCKSDQTKDFKKWQIICQLQLHNGESRHAHVCNSAILLPTKRPVF